MSQPIAITGLGAVSAAGLGNDALWAAVVAGHDGLARRDLPDLPLARSLPVAAVSAALPPGPRGRVMALLAAREALGRAAPTGLDLGLALGSCTGGMRASEAMYLGHGPERIDRAYLHQPIGHGALDLARRLRAGGPVVGHAEACASAACALIEAMTWIRTGVVPAVLVIGCDPLARFTFSGFNSLQVIDPAGCRPFTTARAGMNLGEGAVAMLLEDPQHALRRGATILASLLGWGLQADGHHGTAPDPSGMWLATAMRAALADSTIPASELGLVVAHGTGTRDNDACEAAAIAAVIGTVPTISIKRTVGHTMGAAAAFNVAAAVSALRQQTLPPSAGSAGETISGLDVVRRARASQFHTVLVTSLAFGGANAALVVGAAEYCA